MKKHVLILGLAVLIAIPVSAQQTDTVYQKREVIIIDDEPVVISDDWNREVVVRLNNVQKRNYNKRDELNFFSSIGLGYNGLIKDLGSMKLPEGAEWMDLETKSINFNLMLMSYEYNFVKHFGFRTGLELEVNNFRFSRNMTPGLDHSGFVVERPIGYALQKTKLVNCYLNVPLVLRVGIGYRNQFEIYGGMVGGWRWNSYTKLKSSEHGRKHHRDDLQLRNFHYGYTAGLSFRNIGFYATYYPHSIFKADSGPEVSQVNIGIVFSY